MTSTPEPSPDLPPGLPLLVSGGAFLTDIGLELDRISATWVSGGLEVHSQHHSPWGVVHGGLYATVVETAASMGASAAVLELGQFAVGVNNSTDFLRSMRRGRLEVVAEPVFQGQAQQLWTATLTRGDDGKAVARGTVRLQNLPLDDWAPDSA